MLTPTRLKEISTFAIKRLLDRTVIKAKTKET